MEYFKISIYSMDFSLSLSPSFSKCAFSLFWSSHSWFGMHLNSLCAGGRETTMKLCGAQRTNKKSGHIKMQCKKWRVEKRRAVSRPNAHKKKVKLRKYDTTMTTTTIRYNYVFAFIHYCCLTAQSASLFRCAKCALLHKAFPPRRSQPHRILCCPLPLDIWCACSCSAMVTFQMCAVYVRTTRFNLFASFFSLLCRLFGVTLFVAVPKRTYTYNNAHIFCTEVVLKLVHSLARSLAQLVGVFVARFVRFLRTIA